MTVAKKPNCCGTEGAAAGRPAARPGRIALLLTFWIGAASLMAAPREPIELIHADQVSLERGPEGNAYWARGHVHFRQGQAQLWARQAVWFEATGEVRMFGDVKVEDTLETITADTLFYDASLHLARARGRVTYRRGGDITARADEGEYHRTEREARLYRNAHMAVEGEGRIETWADTLTFHPSLDSGAAWGRVRIRQQDGHATARRADFVMGADDRMVLTGSPSGQFQNNDVSGDTLRLAIVQNKLERLDVAGQARVVFRETARDGGRTTESDLGARQMSMAFESGALRELVATGEAKSRYLPAWGRPGERNDASGDTVKIHFEDSAVSRVQVVGGAQGTYFAPRLAGGEVRIDTVNYQSDYIDYRVGAAWIRLWRHADITYGRIRLTAGQVLYLTEAAVLRAYGLDDALLAAPADYHGPQPAAGPGDSLRGPPGAQQPLLRDGQQEVRGERLVYDLNTEKGRIVQSATHTADGYYCGGDFRKESDEVFYVEEGRYTTCEDDDPHFEFASANMKIRKDDRVVARPVVLRIEQIPVLWIPYYAFSVRKERHSGMLPVRFGNFQRGSRFVRDLGYYFAVSDYWDFAPAVDLIEGEGMLWHMAASYAWRYRLGGRLSGSYGRHTRVTQAGETTSERWNFQFSHNQQLGSTASLSGSGNFVSDNAFYQDFTSDPEDRLNRRLRSQVNLNKRWQNAALVVALDDSRNLDDDSRTSTLPRMTFTLPARQLFVPKKLKGGQTEPSRWYHNLRAGYSHSGQHFLSRRGTAADRQFLTLDHRAQLNFSAKLLDVVSVTPAVSLQETWYYLLEPEGAALPPGVAADTPYRRAAGSASLSTQTNLYGIFGVNRGALVGFRHVLTPSVSMSVSPAVTQNDLVRTYTGLGGGGRRSASVGIGLSNLLQMKTRSGDRERQWEVLNVSTSTSYDLEAEARRLGIISTSIRSGLVRNPDISLSLQHDPYDPATGEIDYTPRLVSVSAALRLSLAGGSSPGGPQAAPGADPAGGGTPPGRGTPGRGWNLSASYRYSESRRPTGEKTITHWISPSFQVRPTPNWNAETRFYYDLKSRAMSDWTIRIHRSLHCWEGEISWVPAGPRSGYYFRINVKALPDVKFEKSESGIRDALF